MTPDILLALVGFAFVSTGTPGPNNMMVLASGANYGFRRTLPHMLGIWTGLGTMLIAMGLGLGVVFDALPWLKTALKFASAAYLLWLAWKIANAAAPQGAGSKGRPFTVLEAAMFQWVNPKAWAMALTTVSAYLPTVTLITVGIAILAFTGAAFVMNSFWTALGTQMAHWLTSDQRRRRFNWTMAALLVLSLYPVLRG